MNEIKEAFNLVKKDIIFLKEKDSNLEKKFETVLKNLEELINVVNSLNNSVTNVQKENFTHESTNLNEIKYLTPFFLINQTHDVKNKTHKANLSTDRHIFKGLNDQYWSISTGNWGVQTDKQTDKQTDGQHIDSSYNQRKNSELDSAELALNSLDTLKKELRLKFKRLTDQELLVFSTIYQFEEEFGYTTYKTIAKKLNLTESSIRDYIRRLINKGVPLEKTKINNKEIHLSVSEKLKKVASLNTIMQLIEL